jgi:hypothetical protein
MVAAAYAVTTGLRPIEFMSIGFPFSYPKDCSTESSQTKVLSSLLRGIQEDSNC